MPSFLGLFRIPGIHPSPYLQPHDNVIDIHYRRTDRTYIHLLELTERTIRWRYAVRTMGVAWRNQLLNMLNVPMETYGWTWDQAVPFTLPWSHFSYYLNPPTLGRTNRVRLHYVSPEPSFSTPPTHLWGAFAKALQGVKEGDPKSLHLMRLVQIKVCRPAGQLP